MESRSPVEDRTRAMTSADPVVFRIQPAIDGGSHVRVRRSVLRNAECKMLKERVDAEMEACERQMLAEELVKLYARQNGQNDTHRLSLDAQRHKTHHESSSMLVRPLELRSIGTRVWQFARSIVSFIGSILSVRHVAPHFDASEVVVKERTRLESCEAALRKGSPTGVSAACAPGQNVVTVSKVDQLRCPGSYGDRSATLSSL